MLDEGFFVAIILRRGAVYESLCWHLSRVASMSSNTYDGDDVGGGDECDLISDQDRPPVEHEYAVADGDDNEVIENTDQPEDDTVSYADDGDDGEMVIVDVMAASDETACMEEGVSSGRQVTVNTTEDTCRHLSTDVVVLGVVTGIFYGPGAPFAWVMLGLELIMIGMTMAGVRIVPIFLVSPMLAFPVCLVVYAVYRRIKRHENPPILQGIVAVVIWLCFWIESLLVYLWADGVLQLWIIVVVDGALAILCACAFLMYEIKRRMRTRTYIHVTSVNTEETITCSDPFDSELYEDAADLYDDDDDDDVGTSDVYDESTMPLPPPAAANIGTTATPARPQSTIW